MAQRKYKDKWKEFNRKFDKRTINRLLRDYRNYNDTYQERARKILLKRKVSKARLVKHLTKNQLLNALNRTPKWLKEK